MHTVQYIWAWTGHLHNVRFSSGRLHPWTVDVSGAAGGRRAQENWIKKNNKKETPCIQSKCCFNTCRCMLNIILYAYLACNYLNKSIKSISWSVQIWKKLESMLIRLVFPSPPGSVHFAATEPASWSDSYFLFSGSGAVSRETPRLPPKIIISQVETLPLSKNASSVLWAANRAGSRPWSSRGQSGSGAVFVDSDCCQCVDSGSQAEAARI